MVNFVWQRRKGREEKEKRQYRCGGDKGRSEGRGEERGEFNTCLVRLDLYDKLR